MPRKVTLAAISAGLEAGSAARTAPENLSRTLAAIRQLAPCRPDLIALTECFHCAGVPGRFDELALEAGSETVRKISEAARTLKSHVLCPIMERRGDLTFNCTLWINRAGEIADRYDKIHPTESEIDSGVTCGLSKPTVLQMDFGKVGVQTCFDVNWPEPWRQLTRGGAELIVWPSAYGGGRFLAARASENQCYVLSATWPRLCRLYDITGDVLVEGGRLTEWIVGTVDLERRLFHWDFQGDRLARIRDRYGPDVRIDIYHEDGWFALQSLRDGLSVGDLIREFDLVPLDRYLVRATEKQNQHRPTRPAW